MHVYVYNKYIYIPITSHKDPKRVHLQSRMFERNGQKKNEEQKQQQ